MPTKLPRITRFVTTFDSADFNRRVGEVIQMADDQMLDHEIHFSTEITRTGGMNYSALIILRETVIKTAPPIMRDTIMP